MLTAYFDEGEDDKVFLIGGWLADDAVWETFSVAWTAQLKAAPSVEYFKNNDAMGLKNQFADWTEDSRDAKLFGLAEIIANHELVGLVGGVGLAQFKAMFAGSNVPLKQRRSIVKFTDPYHIACQCVLSVTLGYQIEKAKNLVDKVNFIFDDGVPFLADCVANYPKMLKIMPQAAQAIAGTVHSKNDRQVPALQAADLLVGQALLSLRTRSNSKAVDILKARNVERFPCVAPPLGSIIKSMERLNKVWAVKQREIAKRKGERAAKFKTK